jgi:hypothetical protein
MPGLSLASVVLGAQAQEHRRDGPKRREEREQEASHSNQNIVVIKFSHCVVSFTPDPKQIQHPLKACHVGATFGAVRMNPPSDPQDTGYPSLVLHADIAIDQRMVGTECS